MRFVKIPYLIHFFTKHWVNWSFPVKDKRIFLTFDDGPIPDVTPLVLSLLKQYDARATFFCVGENVQKHPEIYRMLAENGHQTGNHTFHHKKGWETTTKDYLQEINLCKNLVDSPLFRPPHGQITPYQVYKVRKAGYKIIMWSILSCDFMKDLTPDDCIQNVLKNVEPGAVIVFHDSLKAQKNMIPALETCLKELSFQGYSFDVIR